MFLQGGSVFLQGGGERGGGSGLRGGGSSGEATVLCPSGGFFDLLGPEGSN